ncbi:MAG: reactive intermediate/imine deaminase [Nitrosomonadaceae bacterium]|nr:reactive intermediate/imine deaminase [Nitrosomonadaceae bacterium]|tara:strand:+ start:10428 stop:11828 length:1401 start_codon:yes stop_codon:yes gene_type:complete
MSGSLIKYSRNTENAPKSSVSTQTVAFSHYNNVSAQLPVDPKTGEIVPGDVQAQARQCLINIKAIVESIGHVMDDVVKINIFLKNISDIYAVDAVYTPFFQSYFPTRTAVGVVDLPMSNALVQIDAVISNGEGTPSTSFSPSEEPCDLIPPFGLHNNQAQNFMHNQMRVRVERNPVINVPISQQPGKLVRNTENAPKNPISSQNVAFSHYSNISAQLPIDPKSGQLVAGGIKEQTGQCLKNIKSILESIDVPFDDIVKVTIFLRNLSDIQAVNEVYTTFFPDSGIARAVAYTPARTIFVVSGLPMDSLVQVDVVISHGDGTPPQAVEDRHGLIIRASNTEGAPRNSIHTQTVAFSHYNHIAAQLPIDPKSDQIIAGGVKEQAEQCLRNIKAIVESVDHVMDDIVKINIQLKNIADIGIVNTIYTTFFKGDLPARTVVGVSAISMGALVQIDAVVSNGEGTPPNFAK